MWNLLRFGPDAPVPPSRHFCFPSDLNIQVPPPPLRARPASTRTTWGRECPERWPFQGQGLRAQNHQGITSPLPIVIRATSGLTKGPADTFFDSNLDMLILFRGIRGASKHRLPSAVLGAAERHQPLRQSILRPAAHTMHEQTTGKGVLATSSLFGEPQDHCEAKAVEEEASRREDPGLARNKHISTQYKLLRLQKFQAQNFPGPRQFVEPIRLYNPKDLLSDCGTIRGNQKRVSPLQPSVLPLCVPVKGFSHVTRAPSSDQLIRRNSLLPVYHEAKVHIYH